MKIALMQKNEISLVKDATDQQNNRQTERTEEEEGSESLTLTRVLLHRSLFFST